MIASNMVSLLRVRKLRCLWGTVITRLVANLIVLDVAARCMVLVSIRSAVLFGSLRLVNLRFVVRVRIARCSVRLCLFMTARESCLDAVA